jgi:hypothetical protein
MSWRLVEVLVYKKPDNCRVSSVHEDYEDFRAEEDRTYMKGDYDTGRTIGWQLLIDEPDFFMARLIGTPNYMPYLMYERVEEA